jgi:hypothetical protein
LLQSEDGVVPEKLDVPDLRPYAGRGDVEVRATPTDQGTRALGIVVTALGGGVVFIGGFLSMFGALAERDGLTVGGGIAAGVGAVAIAPGVWMIATSGAHADVLTGAAVPARGVALRHAF